MSDSLVMMRTPDPCEDIDVSLFKPIVPPDVTLDTYESMTVITIREPERKGMAWARVFDVLEAQTVALEHCNVLRRYYHRSDWHARSLTRDGVIGATLEWRDTLYLANPPEHFDPCLADQNRRILKRVHAPIVTRRPKGLIADASFDRLFSKEFCDFLRANGAEFTTAPVLYKGQELEDWFRIFPKHRVEFISPDCLAEPYFREDTQLTEVDSFGVLVASRPLAAHVLALDNLRQGIAGLEPLYVISKDLLCNMLDEFKTAHTYLKPVFGADGPVGKLFYEIMARAKPLIVPRPKTKEEALAAQMDKATDEPAKKAKPEPEREFKVRRQKALAKTKSEHHTFEVRESTGTSGGVSCDEDDFDCLLLDSGRLPKSAWQAPVASWMLARLCAEAGDKFKLPEEDVVDGGSVVLEFLVRDKEHDPVAGFQLQGDTFGIAILGSCRSDVNPRDVIDDFAALLLREPEKLAKCRIRIYDPEWKEDPDEYEPKPKRNTRNKYGWDGKKFLGADNVWCADDCGHERPDRYKDYLRAILKKWRKSKQDKHT